MDSQPNAAGRAVSISEKGGVPVVITYVDGRTSQLVVGISDKAPLSKIAYEERMKAIVGEIPMRVEMGHIELLGSHSGSGCNSQAGPCNPVLGGMPVQAAGGGCCTTLTLPVQGSGSHGFIMSAHGIDFNNCGVLQTTINQAGNAIGTVTDNPAGPRASDSAFVTLNLGQNWAQNQIYAGANQYWLMASKVSSTQVPYQTPEAMQGRSSGYQTGFTISDGATIAQGDICNANMKFVASNIPAISGAPIFSIPDANGNAAFYGIAVAKWITDNTVLLYSPWEKIQSDLGVS